MEMYDDVFISEFVTIGHILILLVENNLNTTSSKTDYILEGRNASYVWFLM